MTTDQNADRALPPELEAIAAAAHDRLTAQAGHDLSALDQAARRVAEAASAALAAGARLSTIADAEHEGRAARPTRAQRRGAQAGNAGGQAQARRRHRVRAGHRPRRPARTVTSRDRRRRVCVAWHRPRDPHPQHDGHGQRRHNRAAPLPTANRARSPHNARVSASRRARSGARACARLAQRPA